ncbi:MAG: TIGR00730 family Rossman fold protein [Patescibacteria group bacterium]|nr:MAG: TIGR00730 family Rossman fold protein [Patescibacteria group bacterium]
MKKKEKASSRRKKEKSPIVTHTKAELERAAKKRISVISKEFAMGFEFIQHYPRSVTFFGSTRTQQSSPHYKKAQHLAHSLSMQGYTIVTGGGPGIMQAANYGALAAGGASIGLNIQLPGGQVANPYVTNSIEFYYFFSRKVVLAFSAEAYIYFPGGFGTLDEFFEIVTLVQTRKIPKVPIILVGSDYWKPLDKFIHQHLLKKHKAISKGDVALYKIIDDEKEIIKIVKKAPQR